MDYDGPGQSDYMCGGTFTLAQLESNRGRENELIVKNKKGTKEKGYIMVPFFELINTNSRSYNQSKSLDSDC